MKAKAWKDVWGSGQGIGAIKETLTVAQFVAQLKAQYDQARHSLAATVLATALTPVT
jgi:nitronate monooxygenase